MEIFVKTKKMNYYFMMKTQNIEFYKNKKKNLYIFK